VRRECVATGTRRWTPRRVSVSPRPCPRKGRVGSSVAVSYIHTNQSVPCSHSEFDFTSSPSSWSHLKGSYTYCECEQHKARQSVSQSAKKRRVTIHCNEQTTHSFRKGNVVGLSYRLRGTGKHTLVPIETDKAKGLLLDHTFPAILPHKRVFFVECRLGTW
jgi:hypothetical protein